MGRAVEGVKRRIAQRAIEGAGLPLLSNVLKNKSTELRDNMNISMDQQLSKETVITVYNWAFERGLMPMRYDWRSDTHFMNDGEPYTTTLILREAGA